MRTDPSSPLASFAERLRGSAARSRRWLAGRGPMARVGLLAAGLAGLGAVGYFASLDDPAERSWAWVFEGRRLSSDDVTAIAEALDAENIPHVADPAGRVGVKPGRKAEALAALARRKVVPPTLEELGRGAQDDSPWTTQADRDRRENAAVEQTLKRQIEALDPSIDSAHVRVHRVRARAGLNAPKDVTAYIYVQTEGGRRLGHRVVEGIETFLTGAVPDLKPEAITVADQTGHKYLAAGNSSLKEQMQAHALEEDWRDKIAEGLRHIPGVGVSVLLESVPAPPGPPETPPTVASEAVRVNGPLDVEPAPPPPAPAPAPSPPRTRANVWVRVPRSFFFLASQAQSPGRHPSPEDIQAMRGTTERLIRDAVEATIPRDMLGSVTPDVVQDDLASSRALLIPSDAEARGPWPWPAAPIVAAAVAGLLALVAGSVRLATRRPSARPDRSAWRPGFVAEGPSGPVPGPSERVRELIRTSPEAAAGVLQRWIGQGGALE